MQLFLKASWQNIIMANYVVPSNILTPYLPNGVELDAFNKEVHVSLVGFLFKDTSLFNIPIPLLGTFEEINLRFYVTRKENNSVKRGVVFINETVPYKAVAWLANKLYHENYTTVKTKHQWITNNEFKNIEYTWKKQDKWNKIAVKAGNINQTIQPDSFEEFIFDHFYGYAKVSDTVTEEYQINHPKWQVNPILNYNIKCDFGAMYGKQFEFLNHAKPHSVFITDGSKVSINWKRKKI